MLSDSSTKVSLDTVLLPYLSPLTTSSKNEVVASNMSFESINALEKTLSLSTPIEIFN